MVLLIESILVIIPVLVFICYRLPVFFSHVYDHRVVLRFLLSVLTKIERIIGCIIPGSFESVVNTNLRGDFVVGFLYRVESEKKQSSSVDVVEKVVSVTSSVKAAHRRRSTTS